jgi:mono/diheme cytochrome c family protein
VTDDLGPSVPELRRFVENRAFRRAVLEASLVEPNNGYSRLRLDRYALADGWDTLPIWNPPVRAATLGDVGAFADGPFRASSPEEGTLAALVALSANEESSAYSRGELVELGRRAFEEWPVQLDSATGSLMESIELVREYGLWVDDRERVGGLVRVALADGTERFAVTCATCHARADEAANGDDGALTHGATNDSFDFGHAKYREAREAGKPEDGRLLELQEWGPGQVDVTADDTLNATAITDLRAVRYHTHLHWAGTIKNSVAALAVRIDTLLITSSGSVVRAPRQVAYALAAYLWSLGEGGGEGGGESGEPVASDSDSGGKALFDDHCSDCHRADGTTAEPVALEEIGTDRAVGLSPERTTGAYRVPSLWGVGDRRQFMHDGKIRSLEAMFDPARLDEIPGHEYGLELSSSERTALLRYVRGLGAGRAIP